MIDVGKELRILLAEDSQDDADLIAHQIKRAGYGLTYQRVESAEEVSMALREKSWDVVIADYSMPNFNGLEVLQILKKTGLDLPFILISGTIGEEIAVQAMKAGADDYLLKGNLIRLVPAVEREIREAAIRATKRRIEIERIELIDRLQKALQARDEFLLIASHELKTPLTSLKLQTQIMKRIDSQSFPQEEKKRRLQELLIALDQQVEKLTELIENLLDVSRISMGRLTLHLSECDLAKITREVVENLRTGLKRAHCQVEIRANAPVFGQWDPLRMEQVLVNLIGNAMKYAAGSTITVTVEPFAKNARLIVQDNGAGIAMEDQDRLFQRFERAASSNHVSGLGLGLYITQQIIYAHGGSIRLESELRKGSLFMIELPLEPTPDAD